MIPSVPERRANDAVALPNVGSADRGDGESVAGLMAKPQNLEAPLSEYWQEPLP